MISIVVRNVNSRIFGLDDIGIIDAISGALTYVTDNAKYSFKYKMGAWDGSTRLLTKNLSFATGLLSLVEGVLQDYGAEYEIRDEREIIHFSSPESPWYGHSIYDYQKEVVDTALREKRGMVQVATGGGKTLIIGKLAHEFGDLPIVIYVVSLDLLSQMHSDLQQWLGKDVGIVGDGLCDIKNITVCSAWTVGKAFTKKSKDDTTEEDVVEDKWDPSEAQKRLIREMAEGARVVILDEAQFAAAHSIKTILDNSKGAVYKYGFSGTPWRTGGDDLLLEAAFGKKIVQITASELIDGGYLVPPKIAMRDIPPYHVELPQNWKAVHANYIVNNELRNNILIANTVHLLEMGRKPLILFREHKHGKILRDMIPSDVRVRMVTGKLGKEERDKIREDFKAGEIDLLLASTVYDQGVDLPGLDALIKAGGGKSTAKALQRIGRVIRGNKAGGKKDAYVVDTFDQAMYVRGHSIARYNVYCTEPRFILKASDKLLKAVKTVDRWRK
jgi:superfamily II DNA or RNA helicase